MTGTAPSLRHFVDLLTAREDVVEIREPVSAEHEIAAHLAQTDPGPAMLFTDVVGATMPVVGNVLGTLDRVALALGSTVAEIQDRMMAAILADDPVVVVDEGPSQQVVRDADLSALPIPTFFEHEGGPYITAGVIIARDPVTGAANASFARVRPLDATTAMVGIAPNHHLQQMAERSPDGRLDIAVVIGAHPAVQLAACLYLALGDDELRHAQSLLGEPLRMVRATSIDVLVPAEAEIVLEGTLDIGTTVEEGPVSEYHGMYETYGRAATARFTVMTTRRDPWFQAVLPGWHREHVYLGAIPIAAGLRAAIARSIPTVGEVAVTEGGAGRLAAVVALRNPRPGQGKQVMMAAWGSLSMLKQVTVVDDDIDVWDAVHVEWARVTRCVVETDVVIVPSARTDRSEPLEVGGTVTKIGFDAVADPRARPGGFVRAEPPAHVMEKVSTAGAPVLRATSEGAGA